MLQNDRLFGVVCSNSCVYEAKWVIPATWRVEMGDQKAKGWGARPVEKVLAVKV